MLRRWNTSLCWVAVQSARLGPGAAKTVEAEVAASAASYVGYVSIQHGYRQTQLVVLHHWRLGTVGRKGHRTQLLFLHTCAIHCGVCHRCSQNQKTKVGNPSVSDACSEYEDRTVRFGLKALRWIHSEHSGWRAGGNINGMPWAEFLEGGNDDRSAAVI